MENINIIDIVNKFPLKNINNSYNEKLINKISEYYTSNEQKIFLSIFYCFLNYDEKNECIIDLDNIWRILGFAQKDRAKKLLVSNFIENIDYKILTPQEMEKKKGIGGYNIQKIFLTIKTFKLLSVKSCIREADIIYEYYTTLEKIVDEILNEIKINTINSSINIEQTDYKNMLEQKEKEIENQKILAKNEIENQKILAKNEIENQKTLAKKEKEMIREQTILEQFNENIQCVYYGFVDNKSTKGEDLIKFGNSNNLRKRVEDHKKTYDNFRLVNAFRVSNKLQIENGIKNHLKLKNRRRNIIIDNINYTELLSIKDITLKEVDDEIKDIIDTYEYNRENYIRVVEQNKELENNLIKKEDEIKNLNEKINLLESELEEFKPSESSNIKKNTALSQYHTTKNGYIMYAFETKPNRFICGVIRPSFIETRLLVLKSCDKDGEMKYTKEIKYVFTEKIMLYLLKERMIKINYETFDGSLNDITMIFEICSKIENLIINNSESLDTIMNTLDNINYSNNINNIYNEQNNPEEPTVRKAKRAVEQVNPETMEIIACYNSIEIAGKSIGLSTGTAVGIALRNKTLCKGFLWRYAGISHEDQFTEQPVIKVCCSNGQKVYFKTIADAAKDCGISPTGLRNRILTHVHKDGYHWVFSKDCTHYK
jgi:hypothetical protein